MPTETENQESGISQSNNYTSSQKETKVNRISRIDMEKDRIIMWKREKNDGKRNGQNWAQIRQTFMIDREK